MSPALPPEFQLLCACARPRIDSATAAHVQELLDSGISWPTFLRLAEIHAVTPLIRRGITALRNRVIPEEICFELARLATQTANRNLYYSAELLRLLEFFKSAGIPAVNFKGPTLAQRAYGNIALREFGDLDILVRASDAVRARDLLVAEGFRPEFDRSQTLDAAFLKHHYAFGLLRDGPIPLLVELHWRIAPRSFGFPLDFDYFAPSLQTLLISGNPVQCLADEDLLLALAAHGSKHAWTRLAWICDMEELRGSLTRKTLEIASQKAANLGAGRILTLALALPNILFGSARHITAAHEPWLERSVCEVSQWLLEAPQEPGISSILRFQMRARRRLFDRVLCLLDLLFMPTVEDWRSIALPAGASILYFPIRVARLGSKYGPGLLRSRLSRLFRIVRQGFRQK